MKNHIKLIAVALSAAVLVSCASKDAMMEDKGKDMAMDAMAPFGGPDDVAYAASLWQALGVAGLVGANARSSAAYPGQHPHGAVLRNITDTVTINGQSHQAIVKSNYGGEGVTVASVNANPNAGLGAVTVMLKRPGYDPDNNDWFWAKYLPDGSLDKNPKGMQLAGRVAKVDPPAGCIACHKAAPGGDMVFTN